MNNDVSEEIVLLMREFKELVQEHQQSLQSQRLLLLAMSGSVADVPRLTALYQALLREHERSTGQKLPAIPIGE